MTGEVAQRVSLYTNARSGPVKKENPTLFLEYPNVGALWNTYVSFLPPLFDKPLEVKIQFVLKMTLQPREEVFLVIFVCMYVCM
jgi:hypothetical protein